MEQKRVCCFFSPPTIKKTAEVSMEGQRVVVKKLHLIPVQVCIKDTTVVVPFHVSSLTLCLAKIISSFARQLFTRTEFKIIIWLLTYMETSGCASTTGKWTHVTESRNNPKDKRSILNLEERTFIKSCAFHPDSQCGHFVFIYANFINAAAIPKNKQSPWRHISQTAHFLLCFYLRKSTQKKKKKKNPARKMKQTDQKGQQAVKVSPSDCCQQS